MTQLLRIGLVVALVAACSIAASADFLAFHLMQRALINRLHFDPTPIEQWHDAMPAVSAIEPETEHTQ